MFMSSTALMHENWANIFCSYMPMFFWRHTIDKQQAFKRSTKNLAETTDCKFHQGNYWGSWILAWNGWSLWSAKTSGGANGCMVGLSNSLLFHLRAEMPQTRDFPNRSKNTAQALHLFTYVRLPFEADNSSWLNLFSESNIREKNKNSMCYRSTAYSVITTYCSNYWISSWLIIL